MARHPNDNDSNPCPVTEKLDVDYVVSGSNDPEAFMKAVQHAVHNTCDDYEASREKKRGHINCTFRDSRLLMLQKMHHEPLDFEQRLLNNMKKVQAAAAAEEEKKILMKPVKVDITRDLKKGSITQRTRSKSKSKAQTTKSKQSTPSKRSNSRSQSKKRVTMAGADGFIAPV